MKHISTHFAGTALLAMSWGCDAKVGTVAVPAQLAQQAEEATDETEEAKEVAAASVNPKACTKWADPLTLATGFGLSPSNGQYEASGLAVFGSFVFVNPDATELSAFPMPKAGLALTEDVDRVVVKFTHNGVVAVPPELPDVEAIDLGKCDKGACLFLADTGNYRLAKDNVTKITRSVVILGLDKFKAKREVELKKRLFLAFPDSFTDAEGQAFGGLAEVDVDAMAVDPISGDLLFANKSIEGGGQNQAGLKPTLLYKIAKADWSAASDGATLSPAVVGRVPMEYLAAMTVRTNSDEEQKQRFLGFLPEDMRAGADQILHTKNLLDADSVEAMEGFVQAGPEAAGASTIADIWDGSGLKNAEASKLDAMYAVVTDMKVDATSGKLVVMTYRGPVVLNYRPSKDAFPKRAAFLMEKKFEIVPLKTPLYQMEALALITQEGGKASSILYTTEQDPNGDSPLALLECSN